MGATQNLKLERVKGIEPSSAAWEAAALPLSYTRDDAKPWEDTCSADAPIIDSLRRTTRAAND
jgi:hypothetical protein